MISLYRVYKSFSADNNNISILKDISFTVSSGEFIAIMGPSGCGKSTLLSIIGLLDNIDNGSYKLAQEDITNAPESMLAKLRKQYFGFVFQSFHLIEYLNVWQNIELPLIYQNVDHAERKQRVEYTLFRMNLADRAYYLPQQLSGGQQQRVAIARALVTKPCYILADEPTGNLDSVAGKTVMNVLMELTQQGVGIIMVTHSEQHAAYAKRIIRLSDGALIEDKSNPIHA